MKTFPKQVLRLLLCVTLFASVVATKAQKVVYKFDIKENIAPGVWLKLQKAFDEADSIQADLFLIHMNTYGGTVVDADSIRTKLLNTTIPVYVFIDNNAASAGALISMACDSIYMRPGANIGAATVVNQTGEAAPDKYQSYMRSTMRATAEAAGRDTVITGKDTTVTWRRNPKIAEAMVDESLYISGVSDTGKVLTLTPNEALDLGMCDGIVNNIDELLKRAQIEEYVIKEYTPTWIDQLLGFLTNPILSGIFIMAIIGGIYFELQTPGIGFALIVAILGAVLYFAPLYIEGMAENWEILLFVIGVFLIALEIFVIPGFGIAGVSGILLAFVGLALAMVQNVNFNFDGVNIDKLMQAFVTVTFGLITGIGLAVYLASRLLSGDSKFLKTIALTDSQQKAEGFTVSEERIRSLVGEEGTSFTVLRPSGKVTINETVYDAISLQGMIDPNCKIVVVRHESGQVYVKKRIE